MLDYILIGFIALLGMSFLEGIFGIKYDIPIWQVTIYKTWLVACGYIIALRNDVTIENRKKGDL